MKLLGFLLAATLTTAMPINAVSPTAPDFPTQGLWFNAKPLSFSILRDHRAVIVAFINFADIRSLRTLETLKAWDKQYSLSGLMVIAVHTPQWAFQRDEHQLRDLLRLWDIEFPVIADNDKKLWAAYANEGLPTIYLIDSKGRIVQENLGESNYSQLEAHFRAIIASVPGFSRPRSPPFYTLSSDHECAAATEELELGQRKGRVIDFHSGSVSHFLVSSREGELSKSGNWQRSNDALILNQENPNRSAFIRAIYRGSQVFSVLGPSAGALTQVFIRQDGLWLHSGNASKAIQFDNEGRSYISVTTPKLYELVRNPNDAVHEIALFPIQKGTSIYTFSFSDNCRRLRIP